MIVVSNSSPLINLARIGILDLLTQLYGELTIPEAVWLEVVIHGAGLPGADEVKNAAWIKKKAVSNTQLVAALQQELDAGEAEAVALALEAGADALLMDERLGRETARHLGVRCIGLIERSRRSEAERYYRRGQASLGCAPRYSGLSHQRRPLCQSVARSGRGKVVTRLSPCSLLFALCPLPFALSALPFAHHV